MPVETMATGGTFPDLTGDSRLRQVRLFWGLFGRGPASVSSEPSAEARAHMPMQRPGIHWQGTQVVCTNPSLCRGRARPRRHVRDDDASAYARRPPRRLVLGSVAARVGATRSHRCHPGPSVRGTDGDVVLVGHSLAGLSDAWPSCAPSSRSRAARSPISTPRRRGCSPSRRKKHVQCETPMALSVGHRKR